MQRLLLPVVLIVVLSSVAWGQQPNGVLAALSINGTGQVDAMGVVTPTDSQVVPPPVGSAPTYHHRASQGTAIGLSVQGTPGLPILLIAGSPAAMPVPVGSDFLELDQATAQLLVDGLSPSNFLDFGLL